MKVGLTASTLLHASVLVLALVTFTGAEPFEPVPESMPVDIISASDFTKLTKGVKTGEKTEKPKQVAEKVGDPTPPADHRLKASDKAPVDVTQPPPPSQPPKPPEPKPVEKPPEPKPPQPKPPEPKPVEPKPAEPQPKADDAPKNEPKPAETKPQQEAALQPAPLPPRRPPVPRTPPRPVESDAPARDFSTDEIKELLDKRTPNRQVASGGEVSDTTSLGSPQGTAATLSMSEIDAFRARMRQCWNTTGIPNDQPVYVDVRVDLKPDGSLAGEPQVMRGTAPPYGPVLARTAIAALVRCQPFTMFRKETYNQWKSMDLTFRPQEFDR
ncbi:cell envelope biogenesis protein TolA [Xanthobacter sp. TB0136]|uniref:cell envelope biogenesis protein TolA n=1 Tax=Xanthobacter sp. TB0136 TaxID=3459177 RepID=UPI00403A1052